MNRPTDKTDQELLAAFSQGDMKAFETLYNRHASPVLAYLVGRIGNRDKAEDVFQDIFIGFVKQATKIRENSNVRAYLFRSARNRLANAYRGEGRRQDLKERFKAVLALRDNPAPRPDKQAEQNDLLDQLNAAISELNEDEREIVVLHTQAGLTFEEIAEVTETPFGTVASRYRRSLEKLRTGLEELDHPRPRAGVPEDTEKKRVEQKETK